MTFLQSLCWVFFFPSLFPFITGSCQQHPFLFHSFLCLFHWFVYIPYSFPKGFETTQKCVLPALWLRDSDGFLQSTWTSPIIFHLPQSGAVKGPCNMWVACEYARGGWANASSPCPLSLHMCPAESVCPYFCGTAVNENNQGIYCSMYCVISFS